jgi:hypothetical protein
MDSAARIFRRIASISGLGILLIGPACATTTTETRPGRTPDAEREHLIEVLQAIEAPCSGPSAPAREEPSARPPQVFLELALVELPAGAEWRSVSGSLAWLGGVTGARQLGTPHLLVPLDDSTTWTSDEIVRGPGAALEPGLHLRRITVHPTRVSPDHIVLRLDVALEARDPSSSPSNPSVLNERVRTVLAPRERELAKIAGP